MNIFDIPVTAVSSLGEGLSIIYPSNHSQEEADFDSIALVGHEAYQSNFHSLQQMDGKTDVLEEIKLKYREGRITEDQICLKCGKKLTAIPKASMRGTIVFCRSMPTITYYTITYWTTEAKKVCLRLRSD